MHLHTPKNSIVYLSISPCEIAQFIIFGLKWFQLWLTQMFFEYIIFLSLLKKKFFLTINWNKILVATNKD